jgi:hypothetical protein
VPKFWKKLSFRDGNYLGTGFANAVINEIPDSSSATREGKMRLMQYVLNVSQGWGSIWRTWSCLAVMVTVSVAILPKRLDAADMDLFLPAIVGRQCIQYHLEKIIITPQTEYRFFCDQHHFMTLVDDQGTVNFRPHPGVDVNGWGSSWYAQPFLSGAGLRYTTIDQVQVDNRNGISISASGMVSRGANSTFGSWSGTMRFSYLKSGKKIRGAGRYVIQLSGQLNRGTGDLNLYKIASNYLKNVPLLTGGNGDTGDMNQVIISHGPSSVPYSFSPWIPPHNPAFFPTDTTDRLSVDVIGQCNNIDTGAQGYAPIMPAYKPSMKIIYTAANPNALILFGAMYDITKSKDFWEDNVGITPIIHQSSSLTSFKFEVTFESTALKGDGSGSCQ